MIALRSAVTFVCAISLVLISSLMAKEDTAQRMEPLKVRVVDADKKPVAGVTLIPWALRSSQGHGWWRENDELSGTSPQAVKTDENGEAVVLYPFYRHTEELIKTISVSLHVDHPQYAYQQTDIDVPVMNLNAPRIKLERGFELALHPTLDGKPFDLEHVYAIWSDDRCWYDLTKIAKDENGVHLPPLKPGKNTLMLVNIVDQRATHFSEMIELNLDSESPKALDVVMQAAMQVHGRLSDDVPRPVKDGRVRVSTLPTVYDPNHIQWDSWTRVNSDGTFTIDAWPQGKDMQVIALCDGYIAKSGKAPSVVENALPADQERYQRPQVFSVDEDKVLTVEMEPLIEAEITVIDDSQEGPDIPLQGISVSSWPNVGWWNSGSQIYAHPLYRTERFMLTKDFEKAQESDFPQPFQAISDVNGKVNLQLPLSLGKQSLDAHNDKYQLPAFLGRRYDSVDLAAGQVAKKTLRMQRKGDEKLGEWDKLAGVVFGCTTREGRQICALPEVRKKMDEFEKRYREAKDKQDPQLLYEAYSTVADAFNNASDPVEAAKWQMKAEQEKAKIAVTK